MAVVDFPAASFTVEGDPETIRESGRSYSRFATVASEAASGIRSLDAGSWVGSEGEDYRARVAEIPPPLEVAHGAFGEVAVALAGFADAVESAQRRMRSLRSAAESTHADLATATASRDRMRPPDDAAQQADPGAQDRYDTEHGAATTRVSRLQGTWSDQLGSAASIRSQVSEAASRAAARVRAAGRRSPTADQNWFSDHWEKAGHWIDEHGEGLRTWLAQHAGILRTIATVLKVVGIALMAVAAVLAAISAVAGFFSFGIGWLGEVPAGTLFLIGSALYGGGDALDIAVDWGEGRIDGTGLMWRAGLTLVLSLAGGAVVKIGGKAVLRVLRESGADKKIVQFVEGLLGRVRRREDEPRTGRPGQAPDKPVDPGPPEPPAGRVKGFNPAEQRVADRLTAEGHTVEKIPEDPPRRTADALVDGRPVEFKEVTTDRAETVMDRLRSSVKGEGQSAEVVIDASGTAMTRETAEQAVRRFLSTKYGERLRGVTIYGDGWTYTWGDPL